MAIRKEYRKMASNIKEALDRDGAVVLQEFFKNVPTVEVLQHQRDLDKFSYSLCRIDEHVVSEIGEFLSLLIGCVDFNSVKCMRFESGDYTLLHDSISEVDGITILYDFIDGDAKCVFTGAEEFGFSGVKNTLVMVRGAYRHYFKYVNKTQKSRTVLVLQVT